MKKILMILMLAVIGFTVTAQITTEEHTLLYADTNALPGGDVFVRHVYGLLPVEKPNGEIQFAFSKIYYLNGEIIVSKDEGCQGEPTETIVIGSNTYTLLEVYNMIITINEQYWQMGCWQIFLQKIN